MENETFTIDGVQSLLDPENTNTNDTNTNDTNINTINEININTNDNGISLEGDINNNNNNNDNNRSMNEDIDIKERDNIITTPTTTTTTTTTTGIDNDNDDNNNNNNNNNNESLKLLDNSVSASGGGDDDDNGGMDHHNNEYHDSNIHKYQEMDRKKSLEGVQEQPVTQTGAQEHHTNIFNDQERKGEEPTSEISMMYTTRDQHQHQHQHQQHTNTSDTNYGSEIDMRTEPSHPITHDEKSRIISQENKDPQVEFEGSIDNKTNNPNPIDPDNTEKEKIKEKELSVDIYNNPCGVCGKDHSLSDDPLLFCDGCDVPVHQNCYGVVKVPENEYYCKPCSFDLHERKKQNMAPPSRANFLGRHIKCVICKTKFNHPLAFTNVKKAKNKWCHVICVQYISETWFDDEHLNDTCNVKGIYPARFEGQCIFCKRTKGAKVFCSIKSCQARFHASCGILNNCMFEDIASPEEEYSNRVVYCHKHLPEQIESSGDWQLLQELKLSQDLSASCNRNNLGWGKEWDEKIAKQREDEELLELEEKLTSRTKQRKKSQQNETNRSQRKKRKGRRFAEETNSDEEDRDSVGSWEPPSETKESQKDEITKQNEKQKKTPGNLSSLQSTNGSSEAQTKKKKDSKEHEQINTPKAKAKRQSFFSRQKRKHPDSKSPDVENSQIKSKRRKLNDTNNNNDITIAIEDEKNKTSDEKGGGEKSDTKVISEDLIPRISLTGIERSFRRAQQQKEKEKEKEKEKTLSNESGNTDFSRPARLQPPTQRQHRSGGPGKANIITVERAPPKRHTRRNRNPQLPDLPSYYPANPIGNDLAVQKQLIMPMEAVPIPVPVPVPVPTMEIRAARPLPPPILPIPTPFGPPMLAPFVMPEPEIAQQPAMKSNTIWVTCFRKSSKAITEPDDQWNDFVVQFDWLSGCKLQEWPLPDVRNKDKGPIKPISAEHGADYHKCRKYIDQIKIGGPKAHLKHHWMVCEIHPYNEQDVDSYGNFANYWKSQKKVVCTKQHADFHHEILFYLIPPDEDVIPVKAMRDVFDIDPPSGLMWAIIFVQNLKDEDRKESLQANGRNIIQTAVNNNANSNQNEDNKAKDPRLRRTLDRERHRHKEKSKDKDKDNKEKDKDKDKNKQTVEKLPQPTTEEKGEVVEKSSTPRPEKSAETGEDHETSGLLSALSELQQHIQR